MEDDTELVSLYTEEYENIYSNIRDIDKIDIKTILDKQEDTYALRELNNKHYMFIS